MTQVPADDRAYRPCAGAMLINVSGLVFVGQRQDQTAPAWQMPQGGIDAGETPREAVLRELREETGAARAKIIAEAAEWLYYDLPADLARRAWSGRYRGQKQKWFALRFTGGDDDIDLGDGPDAEFTDWKWVEMQALPSLTVDFKRALYERLVREFGHLGRA